MCQPIRRLMVVVFLSCCLAVPAVYADVVFVDCDAPGPLTPPNYTTINAALNALAPIPGNHTIHVTGTCEEKVTLNHRELITIEGPDGGFATIARPAGLGGPTVELFGSRNIALRRLVIRDGAPGLLLNNASSGDLGDITLENNSGGGLAVQGESTVLMESAFVSRQNNRFGVRLNNSVATALNPGSISVENNTGAGFDIGPRSFLNIGRDDGNLPTRITGNQGPGILGGNDSIILLNGDTIIESNAGNAVNINAGSRMNMFSRLTQSILRNNGFGINAGDGSTVALNGNILIQNNGSGGVQVGAGSNLFINQAGLPGGGVVGVVIEGHNTLGINIVRESSANINGAIEIRSNGFGSPQPEIAGGIRLVGGALSMTNGATVSGNNARGILAHGNGQIFLFASKVINNTGPGIAADLGIMLEIGPQTLASMPTPPPPVDISGNSAEGVRLTGLSATRIYQTPTMTGNGGASISCDKSSWLLGNLTGLGNVKCANTDAEKTDKK